MTAIIIIGSIVVVAVVAGIALLSYKSNRKDVGHTDLPADPQKRNWTDAECDKSLTEVFDEARKHAEGAVSWYAAARRPKRVISTVSRAVALVAVTVAGLIPMVNSLLTNKLDAITVSIAVAIAAAALAFDRFWGGSTGWIRYMKSEQLLHDAIDEFKIGWEEKRAAWRGAPPAAEAVTAALGYIREFTTKINGIVQTETDKWIEEFDASLKQLDEAIVARKAEEKARREAEREGAVNVIVENAEQCTAGWAVSVDDGGEVAVSGSETALKLPARIHKFRVRGRLKNAAADTEESQMVNVPAGAIVNVKFKL